MIKFLVMDVDGTLTDGKIYMDESGELFKAFSIKDGCGIKDILPTLNIEPIIITARDSKILENRCKELNITKLYQGIRNKIQKLNEIIYEYNKLSNTSLTYTNVAYIGDDILDLQCMKPIKEAGGLIGCPADAVKKVKDISSYICKSKGGEGAVREFIDWLLKKNKRIDTPMIAFSNHPHQSLHDSSPTVRRIASLDRNNRLVKNNLQERVNEAISYISKLNHKVLKEGKYEVSDDFYYIVKKLETHSREQNIFESHRQYIDIQWVIEGLMAIETADISTLIIEKEYDSEKDVSLWLKQENLMHTILSPGSYAVLYPNNAHISAIAVNNQPHKIKLLVGKIRI